MNSNKNIVCPLCKRRFLDRSALAQHRADAHGLVSDSKSKKLKVPVSVRAANQRGKSSIGGITVAPLNVPQVPGSAVTITGEDRVVAVKITASTAVFSSVAIHAHLCPRLATLSKAYQRMRWVKLEMYVSPQAPLTTTGGYVSGFVLDADDPAVTLSQLSATQGARTMKWYETATIAMPGDSRLYYTSVGEEAREYSPGKFWLISDGLPTSTINVVITARWTVQLSKPFMSAEGNIITPESVWPVAGYTYYVHGSTAATTAGDFSSWFPNVNLGQKYHYYRCPTFDVEWSEGAGDTGSTPINFVIYNSDNTNLYGSNDGLSPEKRPWQSNLETRMVLPCGTLLKYVGSGNSACPATMTNIQSSECGALQSKLEALTMRYELLSKQLMSLESPLSQP